MRVVDIIPKDISIVLDISAAELDKLLFCLDRCAVNYSSEDTCEQEKVTYFTDVFYKTLLGLKEKLNGN